MIADWTTEDRQYLRNQVMKNNQIKDFNFLFFKFFSILGINDATCLGSFYWFEDSISW
jgi:hypothetical protein